MRNFHREQKRPVCPRSAGGDLDGLPLPVQDVYWMERRYALFLEKAAFDLQEAEKQALGHDPESLSMMRAPMCRRRSRTEAIVRGDGDAGRRLFAFCPSASDEQLATVSGTVSASVSTLARQDGELRGPGALQVALSGMIDSEIPQQQQVAHRSCSLFKTFEEGFGGNKVDSVNPYLSRISFNFEEKYRREYGSFKASKEVALDRLRTAKEDLKNFDDGKGWEGLEFESLAWADRRQEFVRSVEIAAENFAVFIRKIFGGELFSDGFSARAGASCFRATPHSLVLLARTQNCTPGPLLSYRRGRDF